MCVRLRFGDKLVSTSLKVDTKPGVWLRNVVMISLCIMLTSRNQRIFKLISSAEFLKVHQNIQNWFRFLFFIFYFCGFRFRFEKEAYIYCGQITWEILFAFKFFKQEGANACYARVIKFIFRFFGGLPDTTCWEFV